MNSLDELRTAVDRYADRDDARGADAVWAAATDLSTRNDRAPGGHEPDGATRGGWTHRRHRRRTVVLVAATCVLVVAVAAVVRPRAADVDIVTGPTPTTAAVAPPPLPAVVVPDGHVLFVEVALDRIWVATAGDRPSVDATSRLRSFDRTSGALVTDTDLGGSVIGLAATDHAIWVRTNTFVDHSVDQGDGPTTEDALRRIDGRTGAVVSDLPLAGEGPIAASGPLVAVADAVHVRIIDEDRGSIGATMISEASGIPDPAGPGPGTVAPGFIALAFGPSGLYGLTTGGTDLIEMDRRLGTHVATRFVGGGSAAWLPVLAATEERIWLVDDGGGLTGVRLPLDNPQDAHFVVDPVSDIAPFGPSSVVALTAAATAVVVTPGSPATSTSFAPNQIGTLVANGGQLWVALWPADEGTRSDTSRSTTISFEPVSRPDPADGEPTAIEPTLVEPTLVEPTAPAGTSSPSPTLALDRAGPFGPGDEVTITGTGLPAGLGVEAHLCWSGEPVDRCVAKLGPGHVVAPDGRVAVPFTFPTPTTGVDPQVDCTAADGTCRLALFEAGGTSPLATVPIALTPGDAQPEPVNGG